MSEWNVDRVEYKLGGPSGGTGLPAIGLCVKSVSGRHRMAGTRRGPVSLPPKDERQANSTRPQGDTP
jgi:hypothetical protein